MLAWIPLTSPLPVAGPRLGFQASSLHTPPRWPHPLSGLQILSTPNVAHGPVSSPGLARLQTQGPAASPCPHVGPHRVTLNTAMLGPMNTQICPSHIPQFWQLHPPTCSGLQHLIYQQTWRIYFQKYLEPAHFFPASWLAWATPSSLTWTSSLTSVLVPRSHPHPRQSSPRSSHQRTPVSTSVRSCRSSACNIPWLPPSSRSKPKFSP